MTAQNTPLGVGERSSEQITRDFLGVCAYMLRVEAGFLDPSIAPAPEPRQDRYVDRLFNEPLGKALQLITRAAEGELKRTAEQRAAVTDACGSLTYWMFARPSMPMPYTIPKEWWTTPMGNLALRARLWAQDTRLVTPSEAAQITGRSLSDLKGLVYRGRITEYSTPRGQPLYILSEIEPFTKKKGKGKTTGKHR